MKDLTKVRKKEISIHIRQGWIFLSQILLPESHATPKDCEGLFILNHLHRLFKQFVASFGVGLTSPQILPHAQEKKSKSTSNSDKRVSQRLEIASPINLIPFKILTLYSSIVGFQNV